MKLEGLDSDKVDTNDILKVYVHTFTKFIEKEPQLLEEAIKKIDKHLAVKTPKYKKDKEPKINELNIVIYPGEMQEVLFQFEPANIGEFSESVREIDRAMKVIPSVAMDIRKQLNEFKKDGTPMNIPISAPKQEDKPSILEKIGIQKQPDQMSNADRHVESLISHIYEIRDRWGIWKEYYYGALKNEGNTGTWSDIYSRQGMENFLTRLREFFNYWIVTKFLPIHQYAMDRELIDLKGNTDKFVEALARMQHETKQMNPMG